MDKVVLAVDAGGTKTKVCAFTLNGEIVYELVGESGSPAALKEEAFKNIFKTVEEVYNNVKDKYLVTYVQMGISGLGVVGDKTIYENQLKEKIGVEVSMENDAIIALFSIVEDKYDQGVLVLSGTGSATYGINNMKTRLIGGWGHLLTETGSSFYSVKMLVTRIINKYEEGNVITPLGEKFMNLININEVDKFKVFMYQNTKGDIASYSKFLSEEALNGDLEAIEILDTCGKDLAKSVSLQYKHLNLDSSAVIGFRGSFIRKAFGVKEAFIEALKQYGIEANIVEGKEDPIYGAFYMAKRKGKAC